MTSKAEFEASLLRQIETLEKYLAEAALFPALQHAMPHNLAVMTRELIEHQKRELEHATRTLARIRACAADDTHACFNVMLDWLTNSPRPVRANKAI